MNISTNDQNKQWLHVVTYNCSDDGCSGSRDLVLNQTQEKVNEK